MGQISTEDKKNSLVSLSPNLVRMKTWICHDVREKCGRNLKTNNFFTH